MGGRSRGVYSSLSLSRDRFSPPESDISPLNHRLSLPHVSIIHTLFLCVWSMVLVLMRHLLIDSLLLSYDSCLSPTTSYSVSHPCLIHSLVSTRIVHPLRSS